MPRLTARVTAAAMLTALGLLLAACGQEQSATPADSMPRAGQTRTSASAPREPANQDTAWYDEQERAAQGGEGEWIAAWFAPEALEDPGVADLEVRYRKAPELRADADAVERATLAFAALEGEGPVDLLNPLEGIALVLRDAIVEDRGGETTAALDFRKGLRATSQLGSEGGQAAEAQFHAMVAGYFPDAQQVVVTIEGTAGGALFHGKSYDGPVALLR